MQGDDRGEAGTPWVRLAGHDNALNALRLALAGTVLVTHSWDLVHGSQPYLPWAGPYAVDGFFVLSGFLIAGSRERMLLLPYLWRRFLRIRWIDSRPFEVM